MLRINHLSFSYPSGRPLFQDLGWELPPIGVFHLLGANGSGKTTLFNLIARLTYPHAGSITYKGSVLQDHQVSLMPSHCDSSFHQLTGIESLNLFSSLNHYTSWNSLPYHEKLSELPVYKSALRTKFAFCSTGMKQLLNFCRCLSKGSEILLLDEPFQGLDHESKSSLIELLNIIRADHLILLTSHESSSLGIEKAFKINNGRIQIA